MLPQTPCFSSWVQQYPQQEPNHLLKANKKLSSPPPSPQQITLFALAFAFVRTHRDAKKVSKRGGGTLSGIGILERICVGDKLHQQLPGSVANHLCRVYLLRSDYFAHSLLIMPGYPQGRTSASIRLPVYCLRHPAAAQSKRKKPEHIFIFTPPRPPHPPSLIYLGSVGLREAFNQTRCFRRGRHGKFCHHAFSRAIFQPTPIQTPKNARHTLYVCIDLI